jgi:4-amino-4-deoxy-L-arabinose transferase-like glycosyltransferase
LTLALRALQAPAMVGLLIFNAAESDVPRPLMAPSSPVPFSRRRLLIGLVLLVLAFIPRAFMAAKFDVLCPDGPYYVLPAQSMAEGRRQRVHSDDFNLFPVTGALQGRLGLDVETGLKYWNLTCSCLLIPVAYGLFRRQFGEQAGLLAALLLAVHPKMIEWSGEVVREPSFLLFAALALYGWWRGLEEVQVRWLALGAAATWLAVQTRFEGWLLLIPVVVWWIGRLRFAPQCRLRLALGLALFVVAFPTVTLGMNFAAYGRDTTQYELGANLERLKYVSTWLRNLTVSSDSAAPPAGPLAAIVHSPATITSAPGLARRLWALAHVVERGCSPVFGLLLLGGLFWWRRVVLRWEMLPGLAVCLLTILGIWIHQSNAGLMSSTRYCLLVVLLGSPVAALGLLELSRRASTVTAIVRRAAAPRLLQPFVALVVLAAAVVLGLFDSLTSVDDSRLIKAQVGRYVLETLGPDRTLAGARTAGLSAYYARTRQFQLLPVEGDGQQVLDWIDSRRPDVVVLWRSDVSGETWDQVSRRLRCLQTFSNVPPRHHCAEAAVFAGPDMATAAAGDGPRRQ